MDKNTYETYEFLPATNADTSADQFFVVEEDGTFLINRQVQYVAQVQDVKEVLEEVQPCTVYDVSSQQFFVDVDNSAELISVSDQFILPEGETNVYNNGYLLQPTASATLKQMDEDVVVDQYTEPQDMAIDVVSQSNKQGNNFTEVTITDEQYRTLEQKGWILLELNDKIYVLNTLGLHDITSNDKLIQKLKNECQNEGAEPGIKSPDLDNIVVHEMPSMMPTQSLPNQVQPVEFLSAGNAGDHSNTVQNGLFVVQENLIADVKEENVPTTMVNENVDESFVKPEIERHTKPINVVNAALPKERKCLKIKTKMNFKDIPDKVFLGNTVNGKRLVARVVKRHAPFKNQIDTPKYQNVSVVNDAHNATGLFESEFVSLIQQSARGRLANRWSEADVVSANNIVAQLLKLPNLKDSFRGHDVIVTKVTNKKDASGVIHSKSKTRLVTGRVLTQDDTDVFQHVPDLLKNIKEGTVGNGMVDDNKESYTIIHIHVTETTCVDNVVRASVMFNKRQLPVDLMLNLKRRYPNSVFACSACAKTFNSEELLKNHQQDDCLDSEDALTIETQHPSKPVMVLKGEKNKLYSCTLCNAVFEKQSNCQRHIKTHSSPNTTKEQQTNDGAVAQEDATKKSNIAVYKCKMCSSVYFHPSTLSKHIVTRHISIPKTEVIK